MSALLVRAWLTGVLAVAVVSLAACGNDPTDAAPVRTDQVDLPPSYMFEPAVIEVTAGTTVTWTNNDRFTHSVKIKGGDDHDLKPGEHVSILFDEPGEYDYVCTYHSHDMRGKVIVTAP